MEIIQNNAARQYHPGHPRKISDITELVIHGTGGGRSAAALFRWMDGGQFADRWSKAIGLYHFLIDRDGTVYQLLNLSRWAWHSSSGYHDKSTIGVELMQPSRGNTGKYTDQQYASLNDLIAQMKIQCRNLELVTSHRRNYEKYSGGAKVCPGPRFKWDRLVLPDGVRMESAEMRK